MDDSTLEYIRDYYHVPAFVGRRVKFEDRLGTIVCGGDGPYIMVKLDGDNEADVYHPTWHIEYDPIEAAV